MSNPKTLNQWVAEYKDFDFTADQIENSKCPSWDLACNQLKTILKKQAAKYGLTVENFSPNWYCCTWFFKSRDNKFVYCSISDVRNPDNDFSKILIRTAENEQDYHGGWNNYCSLAGKSNYCSKSLFDQVAELIGPLDQIKSR